MGLKLRELIIPAATVRRARMTPLACLVIDSQPVPDRRFKLH